jgi:hypothetical protein
MNLAIVVGCATYEHPIPALRFASNDACRMADTLQTTCGLESDEILLLNEDVKDPRSGPTFTNVLRTLSKARQHGPPTNLDILFFFFSGHGYHSVADGSEYLLLGDSVREDLERTALSSRQSLPGFRSGVLAIWSFWWMRAARPSGIAKATARTRYQVSTSTSSFPQGASPSARARPDSDPMSTRRSAAGSSPRRCAKVSVTGAGAAPFTI